MTMSPTTVLLLLGGNVIALGLFIYSLSEWAAFRSRMAMRKADPVTAFLSIEEETYGLEHLEDKLPPGFVAVPVPSLSAFEILGVDGLDDYRIYCVEDDDTSRLLYARMGELPRECRVPRAVLANVMERTVERLDGWFAQLPEPPGGLG